MKILILVLSATKECYGPLMQVQQETWDSVEHPDTKTLYYIGKGGPTGENTFASAQFDEELEQISPRTLEAFGHSLNLEWDLMARTHSSTYVHKGNLVEFCEDLPKENLCNGLLTTGERPFLWGGGSYIISRDVVEKFVANPKVWNVHIMEDTSLTDAANALNIPLNGSGRMVSINEMLGGGYQALVYGAGVSFCSQDWADLVKLHPHHYVRVKQDLKRDRDLDLMRKLKQYYPA